ncbi:tripartite tricarboxylate transporter substrate binding protein [Xylophilus sp. GOD-11R]|uniref:Bug family tripartite tricarboxylate transporter substrate binding protein n=1 Tax=Xylophilus sp. GOD-11R TaxID=3089814 RepID=UPI00298CF638|nr:tripartite tricarboxylate transporter substrate binding protein [Xylophilus sp. GOD-11R]WPB58169.1 tripartite tricarboxylate transporter substrate binding protein [Xylophilus sp. GOD-11R]
MKKLLSSVFLLGAAFAASAQAPQGYPNRAIRIVVAYPAGGVSDNVARSLADRLAGPLGVPVVVENKAGASGGIGMDAVAKAAPDGYTIGFSAISPLVLNPHLGPTPFDPLKDIAPVASVMYSPVVVLGTSALAARDFRSLIGFARSHPGEVRWATSGNASLGHLMLAQLTAAANVTITHIPYKGGGQQLNDALGGQFEVLSTNAAPAIAAQAKQGKLVPLAVGAPSRLGSLPDVPTLGELGYGSANLSSVFGIFAPGRTPAAVVQRLNAEINRILANPEFRNQLLAADNVATTMTPEEFGREIASESASNGRIIRAAGIKAE